MSFSSITTSPKGTVTASQSKRVKPTLSLSPTSPKSTRSHELFVNQLEVHGRPISPALIPIPSPVLSGANLAPWKTSNGDGTYNNMDMPPAPHLSRFKEAFSPLPLTPGTLDNFGVGGLFDALQREYLEFQQVSQEKTQAAEEKSDEQNNGLATCT